MLLRGLLPGYVLPRPYCFCLLQEGAQYVSHPDKLVSQLLMYTDALSAQKASQGMKKDKGPC